MRNDASSKLTGLQAVCLSGMVLSFCLCLSGIVYNLTSYHASVQVCFIFFEEQATLWIYSRVLTPQIRSYWLTRGGGAGTWVFTNSRRRRVFRPGPTCVSAFVERLFNVVYPPWSHKEPRNCLPIHYRASIGYCQGGSS